MALIENFERDGWKEFFRNCFQHALEVLQKDRFKLVGSSVDDLKSWLATGGITRVRENLNEQMESRQFSVALRTEINRCLEQLVKENRVALLALMNDGVIPASSQEYLATCGFSELDLQDLLRRLAAGERPFEDWMHAHGRSEKEIVEMYGVIDRWLMQSGIFCSPTDQKHH
jgi:hypothetical protein